MPSGKTSWLNDKIREFGVSANGEQLISRAGNDIYVTAVDKAFQTKGLGAKVELSTLAYRVDLQQEWNQIFNDCWRWYRDFFYSPIFNGHDWKAMGEKYRAFIPHLSSRDELNWTMSQMVGELCVSHTYIGGGDTGPGGLEGPPVFTGLLGADLVPDRRRDFTGWTRSTVRPTSTGACPVRWRAPTSPSKRAIISWRLTARRSAPGTIISSFSR